MCCSSQRREQPSSQRLKTMDNSSSSSFKRRCVSMSSMEDIPTCPVVSGVLGNSFSRWRDDIVEVLPRVNLQKEATTDSKHSCLVCGILQWTRPSSSIDAETYSSLLSRLYSVLRRSTQPAHLVVMVTVMLTAMVLVPRATDLPQDFAAEKVSVGWSLLYLCSFSFLFGAQLWMTFVSGLVLLFVLPRHTFARVQSALFPKYMLVSSISAMATLVAYVEIQSRRGVWTSQESYQVLSLLICSFAPLLARLYVVPELLEYIAAKVALERAAGHSAEAGPKLDTLTARALNCCLIYRQVCRSFRKRHMLVAIVNMIVMASNVFHVYYLSSKIL